MKKRFIVLIMAVTVIFSGAAGYGGTYLANTMANNAEADSSIVYPLDQSAYALGSLDAVSPGILPLSAADQSTQARELSIPEIASLVANSVTEVFTEQIVRSGRMGQFVTEGAGSGVVISTDGYIVTNNHVIDGASKITVRLKNGTAYEAKLVGRDSKTDIAVLKINATGLQPAIYGNSESLVVGELAVAIGNPLGQLGGTVSEGIISALGRSIDIDGQTMNLLQTTAAVNPGNSGGGLFNRFGELVGVVNAKSSGSDIEGIGFAIPVSVVKSIAGSLAQYGYVPGRIDFGASLIDVLDARTAMMYRLQSAGVYVSWADAESGLKSGDRIISIDGKEIKSSADVSVILDAHKVGDTLAITVSRGGQNTTVNLKLKQAKNT